MTPVLLVIVSYTAMATGWWRRRRGLRYRLPRRFLSAATATGGHISGTILQVVNLSISLVVYYPFFRAWDRLKAKEEHAATQSEVSATLSAADRT